MVLLQVPNEVLKATGKEAVNVFDWVSQLKSMAVDYAPKIVAAILIYFIGTWVIKWVTKAFVSIMKKRELDHSLQSFLASIIKVGLLVLLFLTVISILGINITSFAALLAGAGLAIGAALNGSLGNLAGGVMILILKPFKVGDLIKAQDYFGVVTEIGIVNTVLLTGSNQTVILPNGALSTGVITNYTSQDNLVVDIKIPIDYSADLDLAKKVAIDAMLSHPKVLKDPAPSIAVVEMNTSAIVLGLGPRIKVKPYAENNPREMQGDYGDVFVGVIERVQRAFALNHISSPTGSIKVFK